MTHGFRSPPNEPGVDAPADGIVEVVWRPLVAVMEAAHRADAAGLVQELRDADAWSVDDQEEASAYVVWILRYGVAAAVQGRPSAADLHDLAVRLYPEYSKVIRRPLITLEDTLRKVFRMPELGPPLSGAHGLVSACAAAGVLFVNPSTELADIRPHLAKWRARGGDQT